MESADAVALKSACDGKETLEEDVSVETEEELEQAEGFELESDKGSK